MLFKRSPPQKQDLKDHRMQLCAKVEYCRILSKKTPNQVKNTGEEVDILLAKSTLQIHPHDKWSVQCVYKVQTTGYIKQHERQIRLCFLFFGQMKPIWMNEWIWTFIRLIRREKYGGREKWLVIWIKPHHLSNIVEAVLWHWHGCQCNRVTSVY